MRFFLLLLLSLVIVPAKAAVITLDPNDYAPGTLLNNVSPHISVSGVDGSDVYASPLIGESQEVPPAFVDSGPIGDQVFSPSPTRNSEWMAAPFTFSDAEVATLDALKANHHGILLFSFAHPVDRISLLSMALFPDAGWGTGSDPQRFFFYDGAGDLMGTQMEGAMNPLPFVEGEEPLAGVSPYAYFETIFEAKGIRYLAATGESEPTTIGRIQAVSARAVPVTTPLALLVPGIVLLGLRCRQRFGIS